MLILFYKKYFNTFFSTYDNLQIEKLSGILPDNVDVIFSNDKDLLFKADVVIFDLPFLKQILGNDDEIIKPEGQIWVAWCLEWICKLFSDNLK